MSVREVADKLWDDSQSPLPLQSAGDAPDIEPRKEMSQEERKMYAQKLAKAGKDLNLEWLKNMCTGKSVLREKMTLFWHGHFACHNVITEFAQYLNNQLRQNALGNFGDMLTAVSKSPAMLQYLNNEQNKKSSPNENFAREVMELFTMGRGNYTEDDIKNAARAFTGWRFDKTGQFVFAERQHDEDDKTFLGQTGNFNGDDVLRIILQNQATANFIVRKIYRYFVNEQVDENICNGLADSFRKDYDISKLMYSIFTADWFYDEKNIGTRIKSPVELIVNMERTVPIQPANPDAPIFVQHILGQVLFNPPNVAGWKGGKNWIDSSSLMFRLSLPGFIFRQEQVNVQPKEDPEELEKRMIARQDQREQAQPQRKVGKLVATVDWTGFINAFQEVKDENLYDAITEYMIQVPTPDFRKETILKYVNKGTKEDYIRTLAVTLMSTPEYQMC